MHHFKIGFVPKFFFVILLLAVLPLSGCPDEGVPPEDDKDESACAALECGANASCQEIAGTASCACDEGFFDCEGSCIATGEACGDDEPASDAGTTTTPPDITDGGVTDTPDTDVDAGFVSGVCEPGDKICVGPSVYTCAANGSGHAFTELCMDDCVNGVCTAPCGEATDKVSYLGCAFWAARLENSDLTGGGAYFSLSISSQGNLPIAVTVTDADSNGITPTCNITQSDGTVSEEDCGDLLVQPSGLLSINLNTLGQIEGTGISRKAYRINTTGKVSIHQFNPINNQETHSSDATLLLPVAALGTQYRFIGWPSEEVLLKAGFVPPPCDENTSCGDGFICGDNDYCLIQIFNRTTMSVIATAEDATTLTIDAPITFQVANDEGLEAIYPAGTDYNFTLNQGDILTLATPNQHNTDLSGLFVSASQSVAVFSSNVCAMIPHGTYACDHIEQQLTPLDTWGNTYVLAKFKPRGTEPDIWRVVASSNGTTVTSTPTISALEGVTLNAGESVQFEATHHFKLESSAPVAVAQFMVGSDYPGGNGGCGGPFETTFPPQAAGDREGNCDIPISPTCGQAIGDPAFLLNVPSTQYRKDYSLLVPFDYIESYVSALLPAGVDIEVAGNVVDEASTSAQDGVLVISSDEITGTTWRVLTLELQPGVHRITASQAFGLIAYGYDCTVSYAYPGGLNLDAAD